MSNIRKVSTVTESKPTTEGAGVRLRRAFGEVDPRLDPFLLLDDFGSDDPKDYVAGFPWHPHRGIETITYVLHGQVAHGDSLGNEGVIGAGDVQWMTAGSGIIHEEMPRREPRLRGFQLWSNLPASHKMMAPRYQDVQADDIPTVELAEGVQVKLICGVVDGVAGPVQEIVTDPRYLDVALAPDATLDLSEPADRNALAYVFDGEALIDRRSITSRHLVVWGDGDSIRVSAGPAGARFLLISAYPLNEPVAWGGPIVMNTQEELRQAFAEVRDGTFIKHR